MTGHQGAVIRVLTLCTGNTCRSPMAEVILAARLAECGVEAVVSSAGTLGWAERAATPHAVTVMGELGLDLSTHRSRRIEPAHLEVDLVLAMTRDHAGAAIARNPSIRPGVFLPSELVRLLSGSTMSDPTLRMITTLGSARSGPTIGRPSDEIADPAGESIDVYRTTAARLDRDLSALARALAA